MKCIEICAGMGGMSLGLQAEFQHVLMVERDAECVDTLTRNGFKNVLHAPVESVDFHKYSGVDLVTGGVPCQAFSLAGRNLGKDDPRNLWPEAIRCVRECIPTHFLFENSANMCGPSHLPYLKSIIAEFESMGFTVTTHKVDAADYGVPQHRKRLLLVGTRGAAFTPPSPTRYISVRQALQSLGPPNNTNDHTIHPGARVYKGHTPSQLDSPSKCITAGVNGPGGGNATIQLDDGTVRYYTIREVARLQTFPDSFHLPSTRSTAIKQLGNACPPMLVKQFARQLVQPPNPSA